MWKQPSLSVVWPSFVRPNETEEQQIVSLVAQAKQSGLITARMALEKLRPVFHFENLETVVEQLEEETKHRTEVEHLLSQAMKPVDKEEDEESENAAESSQ